MIKTFLMIAGFTTIIFGRAAIAEDMIALRCTGDMTEEIIRKKDGVALKQTKLRIERYYEISDEKVVQHVGTLISTTTKNELAGKSDIAGSIEQSGHLKVGENEISFLSTYKMKGPGGDEVTTEIFLIDRQTGRWDASEAFTGPLINILETGNQEFNVTRSRLTNGQCVRWDSARKF